VIWVNNIKRWKRPEVVIELARRLPQFRFVMIGRTYPARHSRQLGEALQQGPANLEYLGPMPVDQVNQMISQSDLLLYTSLNVEGFGNSFMQAWFRGVPTVSFEFELDGILEREGLGKCSMSLAELVSDVKDLMEDEPRRKEMGRRAREYAIRHHSAARMAADYEALFVEVLAGYHTLEQPS
jgi:glycosyltransferase involved in cell wall biosynthesis